MEKYNDFSVQDFLDDDDFIRYVKYQEEEDVRRWNDWLSAPPPDATAFREAYSCLSAMLSVVRIQPRPEEVRASWEVMERQLDELDRRRHIGFRRRMLAAASVIILLLTSAGFWYFSSKVLITTGNAEQKQVVLPDHSIVTLNANSSLAWYRAWWWRGDRQVWLTGEALFEVEHLNRDSSDIRPGERFTAFAGDLSVQVLGTQFNIRQRRHTVMVALLDGKIRVWGKGRAGEPLIMTPGEVVRYDDATAAIAPVDRVTSQPQAWIDHKILANGMTVQDIIDQYEDTYGNTIVLGDTSLAAKKIDGTLPLNTEEGVIYMLANILNANIHREGRMIYLQPKK
jgi:ferric-dicitrate binding protein FerR (iron transport regulator)